MSLVTYYFNAHSDAWLTNPNNMDDGNTGTYAESATSDPDLQTETANTCAGTNLGKITKVEIRAFIACGENVTNDRQDCHLIPRFNGSNGDTHDLGDTPYNPSWQAYIDITSDTNAPATWGWSDVVTLDVMLDTFGQRKGTAKCSRVDIRVTYDAYVDAGLRIKAGSGVITVACQTLATHKLRFRSGATTYGVVLGTPGDSADSGLRIYDGADVKAIFKIS